jgi:hypothetical protein
MHGLIGRGVKKRSALDEVAYSSHFGSLFAVNISAAKRHIQQ